MKKSKFSIALLFVASLLTSQASQQAPKNNQQQSQVQQQPGAPDSNLLIMERIMDKMTSKFEQMMKQQRKDFKEMQSSMSEQLHTQKRADCSA